MSSGSCPSISARIHLWDGFIHSPASCSVKPTTIHSVTVNVTVSKDSNGEKMFAMSAGSQVSLDFGIDICGWISLNANKTCGNTTELSLAFAESPSLCARYQTTQVRLRLKTAKMHSVSVFQEGRRGTACQTRGSVVDCRFLVIRALSPVTVITAATGA
jgi:spore coat protein U-like protein